MRPSVQNYHDGWSIPEALKQKEWLSRAPKRSTSKRITGHRCPPHPAIRNFAGVGGNRNGAWAIQPPMPRHDRETPMA